MKKSLRTFATLFSSAFFLVVFSFGLSNLVFADDETLGTTLGVDNNSPIITATASDGGSAGGTGTVDTSGNPTQAGSDVTFTATAKDINTDQYYLAVCKTNAVTVGDDAAPTCDGGSWAISAATNSDSQALITYTTSAGDAESNDWYAFVCDKVGGGGACFPANSAGDQGFAVGTVTFSDAPNDEDDITIDGTQFRFDTGGDGCVGAGTCVNISSDEDGADAATTFATQTTDGTDFFARGNVTYIYADTKGATGNSIAMSIGTCANCTLSGANLAGGSDDNMSPFKVNHLPSFASVAIGPTCVASGSVDPGNDADAIIETNLGGSDDNFYDSVVQPDGKLLAVGYNHNGSNKDVALARYNADGTLDTTFDTDGIVTTAIGSADDYATGVAIQSDGKIVVVGRSWGLNDGTDKDYMFLARYNTDGSLDTNFNTTGKKIETGVLSWHDEGEKYTVAIQSDGKIVVGGHAHPSSNWDFMVARYNTNGSLDTDFDGDSGTANGIITTAVGTGNDFGHFVSIQSDGKILLGGESDDGSGNYDLTVVRYNTDGTLDTDFDTDGKATASVDNDDYSFDMVVQSDGKIVIAGNSTDDWTNLWLGVARFNTNGSLDTANFGTSGIVKQSYTPWGWFGGMGVQSDDYLLFSGYDDSSDAVIYRFDEDGTIDSGFGTSGIVTISLAYDSYFNNVEQLNNGTVVGVGDNESATQDALIARYEADGDEDDLSDYICVQAAVSDADTDGSADTVDVHVCSTNSFTNNTCDATTLCIAEDVEAGYNAQCAAEDQVPVPTAHGSYDVYLFVVDNGGAQGTGTATQSYTVADVPPVSAGYVATDEPAPAAGGSDTVNFSVSLTDDNGDNDVTNVQGTFFDAGSVTHDCTPDENDCYVHSSCTLTGVSTPGSGKTAQGTDENLGADCSVTVWFNANESSWDVQAEVTDGTGNTEFADAGVTLDNPALQGIDVSEASIAYGTVAIGGTSAGAETSMGNVGNQVLDVIVDGDQMCTDFPGCSGNTIAVSQQKWHHNSSTFDWDGTATGAGPYPMVDLASGTGDAGGCLNRDIAIRDDHTLTTTNESIFWKLRIPASQGVGTYTGENIFRTTSSATCTTGESY